MELETSTSTGGDTTQDRLESFLSADDAPATPSEAPEVAQADTPTTDEPVKVDEPEKQGETPNEYQLADVAKLLGADESALDVDDDGAITVKTKIDGTEGKVKFADLLKSYQLQGHVDKSVREVAEQRKALQEQSQAMQQQMQVQQAVIGQIAEVKAIEAELAAYQGINWNALIDSDPVQAVKLDRQMRSLQEKHAQKLGEVNQASQHIEIQRQQQTQATLQSERQALLKAIPDWSNDVTAAKEKSLIAADLQSRGYSAQDIQSLNDHKAVLLARDAMLWRQSQIKTDVAEKQVRAAPKIIKPGSTASVNRNADSIKSMRTAIRGGSKQSVMDYLLATGKV